MKRLFLVMTLFSCTKQDIEQPKQTDMQIECMGRVTNLYNIQVSGTKDSTWYIADQDSVWVKMWVADGKVQYLNARSFDNYVVNMSAFTFNGGFDDYVLNGPTCQYIRMKLKIIRR